MWAAFRLDYKALKIRTVAVAAAGTGVRTGPPSLAPSRLRPLDLSKTVLIPGDIYAQSFLSLLIENQDPDRIPCSQQISDYLGWHRVT